MCEAMCIFMAKLRDNIGKTANIHTYNNIVSLKQDNIGGDE